MSWEIKFSQDAGQVTDWCLILGAVLQFTASNNNM